MPTSYNAIPTKLYHIVIQYLAINHANPNILHCNTKQTQYHVMHYTIANILLCNTKQTIQCNMQSIICTNAIVQRTVLKCNGMPSCRSKSPITLHCTACIEMSKSRKLASNEIRRIIYHVQWYPWVGQVSQPNLQVSPACGAASRKTLWVLLGPFSNSKGIPYMLKLTCMYLFNGA